MDNLALKTFIEKLAHNKELLDKFELALSTNSIDEFYKLALSNSEGMFSKEEFENYIQKIADQLPDANKNLIPEDSLTRISGGGTEENTEEDTEENTEKNELKAIKEAEELIDDYKVKINSASSQKNANIVRTIFQTFGIIPRIFEKIVKIKAMSNKIDKDYNFKKDLEQEKANLAQIESLKKKLEKNGTPLD